MYICMIISMPLIAFLIHHHFCAMLIQLMYIPMMIYASDWISVRIRFIISVVTSVWCWFSPYGYVQDHWCVISVWLIYMSAIISRWLQFSLYMLLVEPLCEFASHIYMWQFSYDASSAQYVFNSHVCLWPLLYDFDPVHLYACDHSHFNSSKLIRPCDCASSRFQFIFISGPWELQ